MSIKRKLVQEQQRGLPVTLKPFTKDLLNQIGGVENSVLFTGISANDVPKKISLDNLPFRDFMILVPILVTDEVDNSEKLGGDMLYRIVSLKDITLVVVYFKSIISKHYISVVVVGLKTNDQTILFKDTVDDNAVNDDLIKKNIQSVFNAINEIQSYEVVVKKSPGKFKLSKMKPSERDRHIEYTVDVSKRIRYENDAVSNPERVRDSPCEHERIGTWRQYKNGKRVWVKGTTVCKGSPKGRKEKVYTKPESVLGET